jgi:hypothetical protein
VAQRPIGDTPPRSWLSATQNTTTANKESLNSPIRIPCAWYLSKNPSKIMAVAHITELASAITENAKIITDYLSSKNLPAPSFDVDGLSELPISPADGDAYVARSKLVAATKELHDLTVGPKESLRHLAWDV